MRRALLISASMLVLASCGRASTQSLECPVPDPPTAEPYAASCRDDGVLVCRTESGSRCLPAAVSCYADGDYVCERVLGMPDATLEAVCLIGDFDREEVVRTTPRCGELRSDGGR